MDRLEEMLAIQKALNDRIREKRGLSGIDRTVWIQRYTLAMLSEMAELLDEVNFKWWKNPRPVDDAALKGELVDVLHFFVSMCLKSGMSAEELFSLYRERTRKTSTASTAEAKSRATK